MFVSTRDSLAGTASTVWGGAVDIAGQTRQGWENTKDQVGAADFWNKLMQIQEDIVSGARGLGSGAAGEGAGGSSGGNGGKEPPPDGKAGAATAAAAATGAAVYTGEAEDEGGDEKEKRARAGEGARDDQMMVFTKKMIEIRNILQKVGQSSTLTLPSIVVIGSQSSGKSSVLEAIVGHEFLPKGSNMVTRRPIELTLVNTPESKAEYGEFPDLGLRRITDFGSIQRTLTELNLAVPDAECVSDDPIHLTIYSPNVPDLSLIDLPGYIQVVGHNQPLELKQKISELCDKYIQPPNVILAISAADVDLANSTALRASRRVDPRGERTIGVVTKMDLVDATRGTAILQDKQYPLRLGYVGVVSRAPPVSVGLFKKSSSSSGSGSGSALMNVIAKNEESFFSAHPLEFGPGADVAVGTTTLRKKLMHVLEQTMSASLQGTTDAIRQELEEATYEFKVQYNDRPLSAESYLAESLDAFKHAFKQFAEEFGRPQMLELLKRELDQRVLDLLAQRYWNKPITDLVPVPPEPDALADLPKAAPDSLYWHRQLDASTSQLTKLGIGRLATNVVATNVQAGVDRLIAQSNFVNHPFARQAIVEAASSILNDRFYSTSDQVENCIKPYKFEIELESREWEAGREHAAVVLKDELAACQDALKRLEGSVGGRRKLGEVVRFVDKARRGDVLVEGEGRSGAGGFSAALLQKGGLPCLSLPPPPCFLLLTNLCFQAVRLSSSATAPTSSTCGCSPPSQSSAAARRTSTTAPRCSSTPWPPSWPARPCSSSTSSCCPSSTTTSRASSTSASAATSARRTSSASPRRTPRSAATSRSSAARSCSSSCSTRWRACASSRAARRRAGGVSAPATRRAGVAGGSFRADGGRVSGSAFLSALSGVLSSFSFLSFLVLALRRQLRLSHDFPCCLLSSATIPRIHQCHPMSWARDHDVDVHKPRVFSYT